MADPRYYQSPAYQYGLALLGNQSRAGQGGGIESAANSIVSALMLKKAERDQKEKDKAMSDALLQYQDNIQNEMLPTGVEATPPVAMGEDPSLRDYSSVVKRNSYGNAMAEALLKSKSPDLINAYQPEVMKQQQSDIAQALAREHQVSDRLADQRFSRAERLGQQQFATSERLGSQDFSAGQSDKTIAAQTGIAQANRDAAATQAQLTRDAAAQRATEQNATTIQAAQIRSQQKPGALPASSVKLEADDISAVQAAKSIKADIGAMRQQISDGKLPLGMFSNVANWARNQTGMSTPESRNYETFIANMERMRNESLRLNAGVQTEGDAQRAWNELFRSINDPNVVAQRLTEIEAINDRAAQQRMQQIQIRREQFRVDPLDESQFQYSPAVNLPQNQPQAVAQAPQAQPQTAGQFQEGQVYQDANGNKARFERGQWVPVP